MKGGGGRKDNSGPEGERRRGWDGKRGVGLGSGGDKLHSWVLGLKKLLSKYGALQSIKNVCIFVGLSVPLRGSEGWNSFKVDGTGKGSHYAGAELWSYVELW